MKALILAAGRGRRLWPYTYRTPKCLLTIEPGVTILERQVRLLLAAGVDQVVVVAGFGAGQVRDCVRPWGDRARVIYNPFFDVADNLISLWAARAEMDDDLLVINGDNVFHPALPGCLLQPAAHDCQLLVQRKADYDADDMKVQMDGRLLRRIGKELPLASIDAESAGMLGFRGAGVDHLMAILEEAVQADRAMSCYYLDGIQRLADRGIRVQCVDIGDLPWVDVDTPQDLARARGHGSLLFSPLPAGRGPRRASESA